MAVIDLTAYIDVLSSWCYVADKALQKVEKKYGDRLRVEWKIAQLFDFGPLPYTREQLAWDYARTAKISGVVMNADDTRVMSTNARRRCNAPAPFAWRSPRLDPSPIATGVTSSLSMRKPSRACQSIPSKKD